MRENEDPLIFRRVFSVSQAKKKALRIAIAGLIFFIGGQKQSIPLF
jgi:hypothetical protein